MELPQTIFELSHALLCIGLLVGSWAAGTFCAAEAVQPSSFLGTEFQNPATHDAIDQIQVFADLADGQVLLAHELDNLPFVVRVKVATAAAFFGGAAFGGKLRALFRHLRIPRGARSTRGRHGRVAWHALDHRLLSFLAGALFFFSQYLQFIKGLEPLQAGLFELPATLAALVAALLAVGSGRPGAWRGMAAVAGAQLAIAAASVPLLLAWFGSLPLLSPLANLYAAPVLGGTLTLASLLALLQPFDAPLQLVAWLLGLALEPLRWLAAGPQWQIPAPAGWSVVLALLGSVLMVLPSWSVRGLAACLWLPLLWPVTEHPAAGEVWLTVLDIGQGLSVVVETASHTLVYDVGPGGPSGATASRTLLPYLAGRGVRTPDRVMLSHDDSDHAGGWAVLAPLWPDAGRWSSRPGRWPGQGFAACRQGQRWTWDGVEFRVLWPTAGVAESASDNNASCVLKVTSRQGRSMLLTGDLEQAGEAELLAEPALPSDVLLVGHHGSRTSSGMAFLQAVGAQAAIVSAGYRNRYRHPQRQVWERLREAGMQRWRTDWQGAIRVRLHDRVAVSGWRGQRPRYWDPGWRDEPLR